MYSIFNFNGHQVRTVSINGETYYVGKDVATVLGYKRPDNAIIANVDAEDKTYAKVQLVNSTQRRRMAVINESGLYSLIFSSRLPQAKEFRHWVTHEVLPACNKNDMYALDELLDNPDKLIATVQKLKEERELNKGDK